MLEKMTFCAVGGLLKDFPSTANCAGTFMPCGEVIHDRSHNRLAQGSNLTRIASVVRRERLGTYGLRRSASFRQHSGSGLRHNTRSGESCRELGFCGTKLMTVRSSSQNHVRLTPEAMADMLPPGDCLKHRPTFDFGREILRVGCQQEMAGPLRGRCVTSDRQRVNTVYRPVVAAMTAISGERAGYRQTYWLGPA